MESPQLQSIMVVDIPVMVQLQIPLGRFAIEILQLQYIDQGVRCPCCAGPADLGCEVVEETVEIPTVAARFRILDQVVASPVVCNDRCRVVDDIAQFIDGYGTSV